MVLETIGLGVASNIINDLIKKGVVKALGDSKPVETRLGQIIDKTLNEYRQKYPLGEKFPFYDSQIFIEALLKCRLLGSKAYMPDAGEITKQLSQNPNIVPVDADQINKFLDIFDRLRNSDEKLRSLLGQSWSPRTAAVFFSCPCC